MKLVILDRDGVINEDSPEYIKTPEEWIPIPGSLEAISRLTRAGFTLTVATNQSALGRGMVDLSVLYEIHRKMMVAVAQTGGRLHGIFFCPHRPDDGCDCRKPRPGLLHQVGARFNASLVDVPVIGDAARDLEAARAVRARPILVLTGKGRATQAELGADSGIETFDDLAAVAKALL